MLIEEQIAERRLRARKETFKIESQKLGRIWGLPGLFCGEQTVVSRSASRRGAF